MIAREIFDDYVWNDHKQQVPPSHHSIPGLGNLTHSDMFCEDHVPLHYHSNIMEIHCLAKGQRTTNIVQDGLMKEYRVTGNQLLITFPLELHENLFSANSRNEFYAFQLYVQDGAPLLGLSDDYANALRRELFSLKHRHLALGHSQFSLLRTAFNLLMYGKEEDFCAGISSLTCFLFSLKYLEPVPQEHALPSDSPLQKAILYLSEHLEDTIQLQELADVSGYSLSHFKYKFKELFGITPAEYICLQKINAAEKELLTSDISITALGLRLGFSSSNYFCTVFKKVTGCSPSEYRKKMLQPRK